MEEKVKQRLIGVLVIVGALFIILPFLFHNSRPMVSQKSSTDMPNQAGTPAVSVSLPAATTAAANGSTTATQTQSTTTAAATPATVSSADASSTPAQNTQSTQTAQNTQTNGVVTQSAATTVSPATVSNGSPSNNTAVSVSSNDNTTASASNNAVNNSVNTAANNAPSVTPATSSPSVTTVANNNSAPASNNAVVASSSSTAAASSKASVSNNSNALPATTFSGAPSTATALTTGQPNEGPVQTGATPSVATTPAKVAKVAVTEKPMNDMHFTSVSSSSEKPVAHHHAMKKTTVVHGAAWTVQLGVFSDKANATHLVTKLRQHHFEAYSRTIKHGDRTMVAVFVGPEINLQKSESMKNHLNSTFRLNGVVKKYEA